MREVVDELIFVIEKGRLAEYEDALMVAERHGVRAHVSLDIFPHVLARPVLEELDGIALLSFTTTPANPIQLVAKRGIDFALSLACVLVTLPIQALAALLIRITSPGPLFFRQVRCGLNGRHFTLLKFRTMYAGAEERLNEVSHLNEMSVPVFKVSKDPRLTPVGRLLRRLSIDELPQLWNVILGDMSLLAWSPVAGGSRALRALAAPASLDETRPHVPLAGLRPQQSRLRPLDGPRSEVHRHLVADAGLENTLENGARGVVGARSEIEKSSQV